MHPSFLLCQSGNDEKRNEKNLFTLHNIVIDIDCHKYGISKKDRDNEIEKCEVYLRELFDNSLELPSPNTIVKQGVVCSYGGQSNHYLRQSISMTMLCNVNRFFSFLFPRFFRPLAVT